MKPFHLRWLAIAVAMTAAGLGLWAQTQHAERAKEPAITTGTSPALEPVAMQALKTMSDQLRAAKSFTFTARIMREEPATDGQMLDFFKHINVAVERPNRMRLEVKSDTSDVTLWYDGKNVTMMPAREKMYTTLPAPGGIDGAIAALKSKTQAHLPLLPFLESDPYKILVDGVTDADEVGIVNVNGQQLLHLAYREPDADWQLWVTGPNPVLPHRLAIIYKNIQGQPRVNVEFTDWKLNPQLPKQTFLFTKPHGAVAVAWDQVKPRTTQEGAQ
jgi:hypothetical protein